MTEFKNNEMTKPQPIKEIQAELQVSLPPNSFINADCMDLMKEMPDKYIDLAIVDPPYGINIEASGTHFKKFANKGWDVSPPEREYFIELMRVSKNQIIWGGNYFLDELGNTKCFLIWDKLIGEGMSFADAEIAWTSFNKPTRIKKMANSKGGKIHPTQKPIELYKWALNYLAKAGDLILDTHVGSGSSLVACKQLGFEYYGCEIDEEYYKGACKRIDRAFRQFNLNLK